MINLIPKVNYIEKLKGNIEFSNYQIIIEHKYEKAALEFNYKVAKRLAVDELAKPYFFEYVYNKNLKEQEYLILMDEDITHIEGGSVDAFNYASKTLIEILDLNKTKKVNPNPFLVLNHLTFPFCLCSINYSFFLLI